jgi:hypothetical protein
MLCINVVERIFIDRSQGHAFSPTAAVCTVPQDQINTRARTEKQKGIHSIPSIN